MPSVRTIRGKDGSIRIEAVGKRKAAFRERLGTKVHKDGEERTIPAVTEGQTFHPVTASISEHYTTPPKPYSEDTLLPAKETAGTQGVHY